MQTNKTQKTFSNCCGKQFIRRHFELAGLRDSNITSIPGLNAFSSRITAVKIAADFNPLNEAFLLKQLDSMNMLSTVQRDHFNASGINEKEIRAILFGGHMRNCLDEVLGSTPVLHNVTSNPVEVLMALDLIYDSNIDFQSRNNSSLARKAFEIKAEFYLNRESNVFKTLDEQAHIDYGIFFNDEPIEFRMAGRTIVQPFILRLFSNHKLLLEHLELSRDIPLIPKTGRSRIIRLPIG